MPLKIWGGSSSGATAVFLTYKKGKRENTVLWLAKADIEIMIYTALSTFKKRGPKQRKG